MEPTAECVFSKNKNVGEVIYYFYLKQFCFYVLLVIMFIQNCIIILINLHYRDSIRLTLIVTFYTNRHQCKQI